MVSIFALNMKKYFCQCIDMRKRISHNAIVGESSPQRRHVAVQHGMNLACKILIR